MDEREFFQERWKTERPLFGKMFAAIPEGKLDYKPHEQSRPAGRIAAGMIAETDGLAEIIEKGRLDWKSGPPEAGSRAQMLESWEKASRRLTAAVGKLDETRWVSPAEFLAGGQLVFGGAVRDHCWWILFDLVHHRGQLSTYVRPMGGKVPAVYGPSGDEPMRP